MRLLIALLVWAAAVAGGVGVSTVVADGIHNQPGGGSNVDPSSIRAGDTASMFRTANFTSALAATRSQLGPDVQLDNFVVYPGYVSLTAVKGTTQIDFTVYAGGRQSQISSSGTPTGESLFTLAQIQDDAPAMLAQRVAIKGQVPESQLRYMVARIDSTSKKLQWLIYPTRGSAVEYFESLGTTGRLLEYRTNSTTGLQPASR
jgi:hypothetical protein